MAIGVRPAVIIADVAAGDARNRARGGGVGHRRHPEIADAIDGREISQLLAVGAHPYIAIIGIVEENPAGDEAGLFRGGRARQPDKRQRRTP